MKKMFQAVAVGLVMFACQNQSTTNEQPVEGSQPSAQNTVSVNNPTPTPAASSNTTTTTPANPEELPKFEFVKSEFDFGTVKAGEVVKHVFKFKNVGKSPLVIQTATASCGCTVPTWTKDPIAPGASGEINVEFNSSGKSGMQNKEVTITANTQPAETKLIIKGRVDDVAGMQGPLRNPK